MKKLELILIVGAIIGFVMALFDVPLHTLVVSLFFLALGLLYFYLGFALFNGIRLRNIFKAESYKELNAWRILTAIGTGIAISTITIGFMLSILTYPMAGASLVVGMVFATIIIILSWFKNSRERNQFYSNIIVRCLIFVIIGAIFLFLHGHLFVRPG